MRAYIAGPMRDHPNLNFAAFDQAATWLRDTGWTIVSPAEMDRQLFGWPALPDPNQVLDGFDYEAAMTRDFAAIDTCDTIILLPGWRTSEGARRELAHARKNGHYLYEYDPGHRHSRLTKLNSADPAHATRMANAASVIRTATNNTAENTYRTSEQNEILGAFLDLLAGPTGDGASKRSAGLKPSWKIDGTHLGAAQRHFDRWLEGEHRDLDSGCHPLVHAAWRLLAAAYQELAADNALPQSP